MKSGTAFWMERVATIERDGIAASKYARQHGLSVTALRYWCRKLQASSIAVAPPASQFLTLSFAQPGERPPQSGCILVLAGARLEMTTLPPPEWLAAVALATQGCRVCTGSLPISRARACNLGRGGSQFTGRHHRLAHSHGSECAFAFEFAPIEQLAGPNAMLEPVELSLRCKQKRKFKATTNSIHDLPVADNLPAFLREF